MIGPAFKLSVNSDSLNVDTTIFYMPAGTWCQPLKPDQGCINSTGQTYTWSSKAYDSYLHQKEGTVVPL